MNGSFELSFYKLLCVAGMATTFMGPDGFDVNSIFSSESKNALSCSITSGYNLLFVVSALLPLIPHIFKEKREYFLFYTTPALFVIYVFSKVYYSVSSFSTKIIESSQNKIKLQYADIPYSVNSSPNALQEIANNLKEQIANMYSIDLGLYIVVIAAFVLAVIGIKKYVTALVKS